MTNVAEVFGVRGVGGACVGIEVELEDVLLSDTPVPSLPWSWVDDGSLVNGREAVSKVLHQPKIALAVSALFKTITRSTASGRCGIHVHCNVSDFTYDKFKSLLVTYYLLEPMFFYVSGKRDYSCFCVGMSRSQISSIIKSSNFNDVHRMLGHIFVKYDAFNIVPIGNLGTVEFRMHQESNDPDDITKWATACSKFVDSFRVSATTYEDTIEALVNAGTNSEFEQFILVFSDLTGYTFNDTEKQTLISAIRRRMVLLKLSTI